ncbi:MAG: type II toxin-antitoxin system RelE/ParE family toxin [Flavobacteriales bacterium]|nr:type II toxin-antitoxin system RelE/ParE family toxin [Flavobacteriales bacterium]
MSFTIKIEPDAQLDIQSGITWYSEQRKGLGKKFHASVLEHIDGLKNHPHFEIRYDDLHCLPVKGYPYMIHFTIDNNTNVVSIRAVFHTSLDSDRWKDR